MKRVINKVGSHSRSYQFHHELTVGQKHFHSEFHALGFLVITPKVDMQIVPA